MTMLLERWGRRLIRGVRKRLFGASDFITEESFWNQYAKNWERAENNKLQVLGTEWGNEQTFLDVLRTNASPNIDALEIGCGGGRITATGVQLFRRVSAIDISDEMLRTARKSITAQNVNFHKCDGFTLKEFADDSLDFVYSHDVFVQLSSIQVYPFLSEVKRVLKSGGTGLISFYDFRDAFPRFKETALRFWAQRRPPIHRRLHFVTEEMLRVMLTDLGLEIVEVLRGPFLILTFRKPLIQPVPGSC